MLRLSMFLSLLFFSKMLFGQDYTFKVLANKGANEVKSGDSWQPLRTGANLRDSDEIKISNNSYIGLVHSSGKPVEVKKPGSYVVADLEPKDNGSGALKKYTDFILSSNSPEAKKNRLSATGAVHRAVSSSSIELLLPAAQYADVYNDKVVVNWNCEETAAPYVVIFRDMFEDELMTLETAESHIQIDLGNPKLAKEDNILVEVRSKANPKVASERHLVKKLSKADQEKIKKSFDEIETSVAVESAINEFVKAGFYEKNNLLIDAIAAYEKAIELAPDVPFYQQTYDEFLIRHGLKH